MATSLALGRSAREAVIVTIGQAGTALASIAAVKLLTAYLPPSGYGHVAVVTAWVAVVVTIIAAPLSGSGVMTFHETVNEGRGWQFVATLFAVTAAIAAVALVVAVTPLRGLLNRALSMPALAGLGLVFLAAEIVKTPGMAIAGAARWRRIYSALQLLDGWGKLLLIFLIAQLTTFTASNVIVVYAANSFLVAAAVWLALFRGIGQRGTNRFFDETLARRTLRHGWSFAGIGVAGWVINSSDRILLDMMASAAAVGVYVAGYQTASILPLGISMLMTAFFLPILLQWHASSPARAAMLLGRTMAFILWLMAPTFILVTYERDLLLRIVLSGRYDAAANVIPWVAAATSMMAVTSVAVGAFWVSKRTDVFFRISLVAGAINVGLNLLLIPRFGYIAAAMTTFVSSAVQMLATIVVSRRFVAWPIDVPALASIAAGAVALLGILRVLAGRAHWMIEIPVAAMMYGLVSVIAYLLLDAGTRDTALRTLLRREGTRES
jgi:O-antigen/teichoic acid export membrane protein